MRINMEEKRMVGNGQQRKRLSYTELENAAKQIAAQADAVFKENKQLRAAVQRLSQQSAYAELDLMFKVVQYKESFSEDFVKTVTDEIEKEMTILVKEDNTPDNAPDDKKDDAPDEQENKEGE